MKVRSNLSHNIPEVFIFSNVFKFFCKSIKNVSKIPLKIPQNKNEEIRLLQQPEDCILPREEKGKDENYFSFSVFFFFFFFFFEQKKLTLLLNDGRRLETLAHSGLMDIFPCNNMIFIFIIIIYWFELQIFFFLIT